MSISTVPSPAVPIAPAYNAPSDIAEGERRWAAWKARGAAQDIVIRRRFKVLAIITAVAVAAGLVAFLFA